MLDKGVNGEKLTTDEVQYLNDNSFRPKGFEFNEEGSLIKAAKEVDKERSPDLVIQREILFDPINKETNRKPFTIFNKEAEDILRISDSGKIGMKGKQLRFKTQEEAQKALDKYIAEAKPEDKGVEIEKEQFPKETAKEQSKRELEEAKAAFRKEMGNLQSGGLKSVPAFLNLVRAYIKDGYVTLKEIIKRFRADFPESKVTDTDIENHFNEVTGDNGLSGIKKALVPEGVEADLSNISEKQMHELAKTRIESGEITTEDIKANIHSIAKGNHKALQPIEVVDFIYYKAQLDNSRRDLLKQRNETLAKGEDVSLLDAKLSDIENETNLYHLMSLITASQQSLAFRLRKGLLDRDYNLVTQIEQYKKVNYGYISQEMIDKFTAMDKELTAAKEKIVELEGKLQTEWEQAAVDNIHESVQRENKRKKSVLSPSEQVEIKKLYAKYGVLNDITRIATIVAEKDFRRLAKLVLKQSVGDFQVFAIEMLKKFGVDIKGFLPKLYEEVGGKGEIDLDGLIDKPTLKDRQLIVPPSFIRDLVNQGITDIDALSEAVKKEVEKELPDITIRQVRDAITNYGHTVNHSKDIVQRQINEAKRVGRLLSKLEDLQQKKIKETDGKKHNILTERERLLKVEIKRLEQSMGITRTLSDEQRLNIRKEAVRRFIAEKIRKLQNKDFSPRIKKPTVTDLEMQRLEVIANVIRNEYDAAHYENEQKNRTFKQKSVDLAYNLGTALSRALVAGADFSAFMVQGIVFTFSSSPLKTLRVINTSLRFMGSQKYEHEWMAKLRTAPYYPLLKQTKAAIQEPNAKLGQRDDTLQAGIINDIWNAMVYPIKYASPWLYNQAKLKNPYRAAERAYTGAVNSMREQLFLEFAKDLEQAGFSPETSLDKFKQAANITNNLTFRGRLRFAEGISKELAAGIFAPRKITATMSLVNPYYWTHLAVTNPTVAKRAILKFATFLSVATAITLAVKAFRDDDEEDENPDVFNPTSSDFMKLKIGNTRIDMFGGLMIPVILFARVMTGKYKPTTSTETKKLGEDAFTPTGWELGETFIYNKFAPSMGLLYRASNQAVGREIEWDNELVEQTTPMWTQNIKDLRKEHPAEIAAMLSFMSLIGSSNQTYGTPLFLNPNDPKDRKYIQLTRSKNVSFRMKTKSNVKIGKKDEKRGLTNEEYKVYKETYNDYMRNNMELHYAEYALMGVEAFQKKMKEKQEIAESNGKKAVKQANPKILERIE